MGDVADDKFRPWSAALLQGCADVLADTNTGLTGSKIGVLLAELRIPDVNLSASKRDRLYAALARRQDNDGHSKRVVTFVSRVMDPARYVDTPHEFTMRQDRLNRVLTFAGLRINDKGQIATGAASTTLSEAARHATTVLSELDRRRTHPGVLAYCTLELLQQNNFHACLEATKSVFVRLRELTGATGDGAGLATTTLSLGRSGNPMLAINTLSSETEKTEQTGFVNLLTGLAGLYRNPVAHDPRAQRTVTDAELLELLTTLSMIHRRLDGATRT